MPKSLKTLLGFTINLLFNLLFNLLLKFFLLFLVYIIKFANNKIAFGLCFFTFFLFFENIPILNFVYSHFLKFVMLYFSYKIIFGSFDFLAEEEL